MRLVNTQLGSLDCAVVEAEGGSAPRLLVVLCHGFGAPGDDLVSLGPELFARRPELGGQVRFVFPQGPLSLEAYGYHGARAWWLIDLQRMLTGAATPEGLRALRREVPEGLPQARRLLRGLIDELTSRTGLPSSRVVLGGFSQGGMLATDVALRLEEAPAALAILSGTLLCEPEWERRAPLRRGLKVLQSHGRQDPLLPFDAAEALRDLLTRAGLEVDFIPFDGGHTITPEVVDRLAALLSACLSSG